MGFLFSKMGFLIIWLIVDILLLIYFSFIYSWKEYIELHIGFDLIEISVYNLQLQIGFDLLGISV